MGGSRKLGRVRRLVVKVGSGLVTTAGAGIAPDRIDALAAEIAAVREGRRVVLVTSGAIATGVARLGLAARPRSIPEKQAAAAVGQSALMWQYEAAFSRHGIPVGQVLLTAQDVSDRARYLNARNTLDALLRFGVLPIVNENDTVAVEEIKVGDNDNLSAFAVAPQGKLTVDAGALQALTQRGTSLLPSGVLEVEGEFASGDVVALLAGATRREFARGVVNFDADEVRKIRGAKTTEIEGRLGYRSFDEVIHRDNLVLL